MKKMIISAFVLAALTSSAYAQEAMNTPQSATTAPAQDDKTTVDPATLPEAVKATLAGEAYKDWTIAAAWQKKSDASYVIDLKKEDKTATANIDKDGKVK